MIKQKRLKFSSNELSDFCRRYYIRKLSLFGSVLRQDFRPDSDIDVLVEFEAGHVPGFFGLFDMEEELSNILGGRRVEMHTPNCLSRYFRQEVLDTAEVQYEQK